MLVPQSSLSHRYTLLPSLLGFYAHQHNGARQAVVARAASAPASAQRLTLPRFPANGDLVRLGNLGRLVDDSMKIQDVKLRDVKVRLVLVWAL